MAKVTITFEDEVEHGGVYVSVEFEPAAKEGEIATLAQAKAIQLLELMHEEMGAVDVDGD